MQKLDELDLPYLAMEDPAFAVDPLPHFAKAREHHPWLADCAFGKVVHQFDAIKDILYLDHSMIGAYTDVVDIMGARGTSSLRSALNYSGFMPGFSYLIGLDPPSSIRGITQAPLQGLSFAATVYYDGQGFMIPKKLGVKSAKELNGATVCVQPGTTTELNLADYGRANNLQFKPVVIEPSRRENSARSSE